MLSSFCFLLILHVFHATELKTYFAGYPVHFAGELHGEELSRAFASGDIFVMPSDSETLGFVVLEAMASGVPVVGVAAGGLVDLIARYVV
jgi:sulfoquinovosyltransferase